MSLGMNTKNIELLRNRAIARAADQRDAEHAISSKRHVCMSPIDWRQLATELAAAEGAAAGALFALREAEMDNEDRLAIGVDVVSTAFDSGEGRVEAHEPDRAETWGVRWDRTGRLGWCSSDVLRVVGRGVS